MTTFSLSKISRCKVPSGIYSIKGLYNNFHLVGQTTRPIAVRCNEHLRDLRSGKHENIYLQNSFNKHSENDFVFVVLEEEKNLTLLNEKETYWIKTLNSMKGGKGWNLREGGAYGKYGEELRRRVSNGIRNSEKSAQSRRARRKTYTLISPTGEEVTFSGRRAFCDAHKIGGANLHRLLIGESSYIKGWRLPESKRKNVEKKIEDLTSDLQRNCSVCGCIIEYGKKSSMIMAEKHKKPCRKCAAKDFRQRRMRSKYQLVEKPLDTKADAGRAMQELGLNNGRVQLT